MNIVQQKLFTAVSLTTNLKGITRITESSTMIHIYCEGNLSCTYSKNALIELSAKKCND